MAPPDVESSEVRALVEQYWAAKGSAVAGGGVDGTGSSSQPGCGRGPSRSGAAGAFDLQHVGFHVCARVRPEGSYPADLAGSAPALSCVGRSLVVHRPRRELRSRKLVLSNEEFTLDAAFDEQTGDSEVYAEVGSAACQRVARGGCASVIAYGQTSAGKTHTVRVLQECMPQDLFRALGASGMADAQVTCTCVELRGNTCQDLLSDLREVDVYEDKEGKISLKGAESRCVADADELTAVLATAAGLRATASTERNEASSRSHAIYRVVITVPAACNGQPHVHGHMTLVDLAGSERGSERGHSVEKDRLKEAVEINRSLMALKECMRKRSTGANTVPFRQSRLTLLLREVFEFTDAFCLLIACVSPLQRDMDHTANTLRYATNLLQRDTKNARSDRSRVEAWTKADVRTFIRAVQGADRDAILDAFPLTGQQLLALSREDMVARCEGDAVGGSIFDALQQHRAGAARGAAPPAGGKSFARPTTKALLHCLSQLQASPGAGEELRASSWEEVERVVQGWEEELTRLQAALKKQRASASRAAALAAQRREESRAFWLESFQDEHARQRRVHDAVRAAGEVSGEANDAEGDLLQRGKDLAAGLPAAVSEAFDTKAVSASRPQLASSGEQARTAMDRLRADLLEACNAQQLDPAALEASGAAAVSELCKLQDELARSLPQQRSDEREQQRARDAIDDACRGVMDELRDTTDSLLEALLRRVDRLSSEQQARMSDEVLGLAGEYRERRMVEDAYRAQFPSAMAGVASSQQGAA